ncbi:MAG: DNA recombination protein RmuC [Proteobacteria bacterium]|nr:DNA recombination protein RmuC [Pseudomonadota bacterium]
MLDAVWLVAGGALLGALLAALAVMLALRLRGPERGGSGEEVTREVREVQAALAGRLSQMAESHAAAQAALSERLQAQERGLAKALEERLGEVSKRVGDSLTQSAEKAQASLADLAKRLALIDAAQKTITELSQQVVSLQDILANKQARGAFGQIQMEDLVRTALPPSAYAFQAQLAHHDGRSVIADCLLNLPNPPGPIVVDSKFPLESYRALREAADETSRKVALKAFGVDVLSHVRAIAERYIIPGVTAESALMFLPSEAVYAELHANLGEVVERSYRQRVWIVSPTTLMATLNTVRAVLKDVRMREQAGVIQREVRILLGDVVRLDDRVEKLQRHFDQTQEDVRQIRISTEKVTKRAERIGEIEVADGAEAEADALAPGPEAKRIGAE